MNSLPIAAKAALEEPITMDELLTAVRKGKRINCRDKMAYVMNYRMMWDMLDVMYHMYVNGLVTDPQKSGILVCLPKDADPGGPDDYRPLTLLNAEYKFLTSNGEQNTTLDEGHIAAKLTLWQARKYDI
jgi:hypothetical protein